MATYRSLSISIPLKVYVLEEEKTVEFLKDMGDQCGLGFYSEQSYEAMHKRFNETWGTAPLKKDNPAYGTQLVEN